VRAWRKKQRLPNRAWLASVLVALLAALPAQGVGAPAERGTVTLPSGARYSVEIPRTPEARERGLMFRASLPPRTGMLFVFETTGRYGFWMKNCLIPLDLIWLDEKKRVVAILPDAPPCNSDPCPIYQFDVPARYVLELAAGEAKREGLALGQVLVF
jgi:uncharacterized membrane protein (UPF0127 family)